MKLILTFLLLFSLNAEAQMCLHRRKNFRVLKEKTDEFNNYTAGVALSTLPGWTVPFGTWLTVATGAAASNTLSVQCFAVYQPSGFATSANCQSEVTYLAAADGAGGFFQGPVIALQANGNCYQAVLDNNGILYFGAGTTGTGDITQYISFDTGAGIPAGMKVRLSATGAGAARRVTCEYNIGAGWVTPAGFGSKDFGVGWYFDGGTYGISGYSNTQTVKIDAVTIRNLP